MTLAGCGCSTEANPSTTKLEMNIFQFFPNSEQHLLSVPDKNVSVTKQTFPKSRQRSYTGNEFRQASFEKSALGFHQKPHGRFLQKLRENREIFSCKLRLHTYESFMSTLKTMTTNSTKGCKVADSVPKEIVFRQKKLDELVEGSRSCVFILFLTIVVKTLIQRTNNKKL